MRQSDRSSAQAGKTQLFPFWFLLSVLSGTLLRMLSGLAAGLKLIVLLSSQLNPDPAKDALTVAAQMVLGEAASVSVMQSGAPSGMTSTQDADAVVEVHFSPDRQQVTLYIYKAQQAEAGTARSIEFAATDPEADKGRLLGLVIGSLFAPEADPGQEQPRPEAALPERSAKPRPPTAQPTLSRASVVPARPPAARTALPSSWSVLGVACVDPAGQGSTWGANIGWRSSLTPWAWWRVTLGGQAAELGASQAALKLGRVGSGLEYPVAAGGGVEVTVSTELLVQWLEVAHWPSEGAVVERKQRWNVGGSALLGVSFSVTERMSLQTNTGLEWLGGKTELWVQGQRTGSLSAERGVFEVGFRLVY